MQKFGSNLFSSLGFQYEITKRQTDTTLEQVRRSRLEKMRDGLERKFGLVKEKSIKSYGFSCKFWNFPPFFKDNVFVPLQFIKVAPFFVPKLLFLLFVFQVILDFS